MYKRNCPSCSIEIVYKSKDSLIIANKKTLLVESVVTQNNQR